jgi:Transposase
LRVSRQKERRIDKTERPGPLLLLLGGGFLGGQDGGAVGAALGDLLIDGEIDLLVALGFVEGLNNKVRVIQRRAYGLRDEDYPATEDPHLHAQTLVAG